MIFIESDDSLDGFCMVRLDRIESFEVVLSHGGARLVARTFSEDEVLLFAAETAGECAAWLRAKFQHVAEMFGRVES